MVKESLTIVSLEEFQKLAANGTILQDPQETNSSHQHKPRNNPNNHLPLSNLLAQTPAAPPRVLDKNSVSHPTRNRIPKLGTRGHRSQNKPKTKRSLIRSRARPTGNKKLTAKPDAREENRSSPPGKLHVAAARWPRGEQYELAGIPARAATERQRPALSPMLAEIREDRGMECAARGHGGWSPRRTEGSGGQAVQRLCAPARSRVHRICARGGPLKAPRRGPNRKRGLSCSREWRILCRFLVDRAPDSIAIGYPVPD